LAQAQGPPLFSDYTIDVYCLVQARLLRSFAGIHFDFVDRALPFLFYESNIDFHWLFSHFRASPDSYFRDLNKQTIVDIVQLVERCLKLVSLRGRESREPRTRVFTIDRCSLRGGLG